jgi:hypothetical protein
MSDTSITVEYSITTITNNANGLTTIVWELSEGTTLLTESRTGDKFKTSDLAEGVVTQDSDYDKLVKLQTNFETVAMPYFEAFAKRVRLAQDQSFTDLLETQTGDVEGLSVETPAEEPKKPILSGSVKIAR